MADYLFVYRGGNQGSASPEQMQQTMQKWVAWMQQLAQKGALKERGAPLEATGKTLRGKSKSVTDGPYAETKDIVNGYTIVSAKTLDEATELARGCPHFEVDGIVEVRPIADMKM
ncbi:MAG TPA: YciI family protein [Minicystis sp.]|nr:YciI family protein [Minicystis sp.]